MCRNTQQKQITVNEIIRLYEDQYINNYNPDHYKLKILRAIRDCRTEAMGGRTEVCDHCGNTISIFNSCRNRHCPLCQSIKKEQWIIKKQNEVLPFQYFHIVFTLPHLLNPIIYWNKKKMYKLLFDIAKETLLTVAEEEKYFGANIGFFSILHTWGQKLNQHYHLHCAVPGGGYSEKKQKWISCPQDYFVPIAVIKARFKQLYLQALVTIILNNELDLTNTGYDKNTFFKLKNKLFLTGWVVYVKESFKNNASVIKYLAKYTHRIAISNYRIIKLENDKVYFKYRDYKDSNKEKVMENDVLQFIHNFLNHVLPERFVRIRYYGLLSHRNKKKSIEACRSFFDIKIKPAREYEDWREYLFLEKNLDVTLCKACGKGNMICIKILENKKNTISPMINT